MPRNDRTETVPTLPPPREERRLASGTLIGERYEIREFLGRGGHGAVYRVFDREVRREVALKLLDPEQESGSALARLRREIQVARDAMSPRLVRIFDIGTSPQGTYLTMDLVEGPSLRDLLRLKGALPVEEAIRIARELFEGLAALHDLSIVHRDVKPGNILLARGSEVKLADFGLARRLDREETQVTQTAGVVGTLDDLSPEQVRGKEVRKESDLYAAGLVLFEMLAGKLPHEAASDFGRFLGPLRRAPRVRTFRPEVPGWLAGIVARLLEARPGDRYPSAGAVLEDLAKRRNPPRGRLLHVAVLVLLCLLPVGVLVSRAPQAAFSHLVPSGERGIAAVSATGEILWRKDGVDPEMVDRIALARITPGGPRLVAIVLEKPGEWLPDAVSTLSFLDPATGQTVKTVKLPSGAKYFPNDPPRYEVSSIRAVDLSRDGVDEVIVSYRHVPEAPSYTVLYAPQADRARVVFYASGGHRFQGAADLDRDGSPELLFTGINNGWNWVNVVSAVRVGPWPWTEAQWVAYPTASPDAAEEPLKEQNLLWYAVIPRGYLEDSALVIDERRRELRVRYQSGKVWTLGFNGFPPGTPGAPARESARRETYGHFREAERLRRAGALDAAMAEARAARETAMRTGDPWLPQYAERIEAKILAAQGKIQEAEARFASLMERVEDTPEVAYDAAVAFHLAGDLRRAVAWYGRGIGRDSAMGAGKSKHEFLKGEVLALVEEKRYEEALRAVDRFGATYPAVHGKLWLYREYVHWRAGERPVARSFRGSP